MDPDRQHPRRRLAIVAAALLAALAIGVPAAFAATGGNGDGSSTTTTPSPGQTQTQPRQQHPAPDDGDHHWPRGDRRGGPWSGDHRGPCPFGHQGDDGNQGSSYAPPSTDAALI